MIKKMIPSGKVLFGVEILMDPSNSFLCLNSLKEVYSINRIKMGWSDRRIDEVLSNKDSIERAYYIIKNKYLKGISRRTFMDNVNNTSLIKTMKLFGVYETTGRGKNRIVVCVKEIFLMVAMELHPSIYNECLRLFGENDIDQSSRIFIQNQNLFSGLYDMSFRFFNDEDPIELIHSINKSVTGDEYPLMYTIQEKKKIMEIQRDFIAISKKGFVESVSELIDFIGDDSNENDCALCHTYLAIDGLSKEIKIGKTFNIGIRESTMQISNPRLKIFASIDKDIELELHDKFKAKRACREWFNLSLKDVNSIIEEYEFKLLDKHFVNLLKS